MGQQRVRHSWGSDKEAARKPIHVGTCFEISQVKHIRSIKMYIASVKSSIVFKNKWLRLVLPQRFDSVFHHLKDDASQGSIATLWQLPELQEKETNTQPNLFEGKRMEKINWLKTNKTKQNHLSFFLKEATIL